MGPPSCTTRCRQSSSHRAESCTCIIWGGVSALPPRSWLDEAPTTRELLMTHVPVAELDKDKMQKLKGELEALKTMNPAEAIATLQRLHISSSEKLQLYRDLSLEALDVHPDG